jgi:phosphohistidine phosphatase
VARRRLVLVLLRVASLEMTAKRLALLRHAKSSWSDSDLDDHERPLNGRGRRAAAQMGRYLREHELVPELVLCSSALRTRQTLDLLALGDRPVVRIEDVLYAASASTLLGRLRLVEDDVGSVLLIAHNPGIQDLARSLTGGRGGIGEKYPTGALADLEVDAASWEQLGPATATLHAFVAPKDLG